MSQIYSILKLGKETKKIVKIFKIITYCGRQNYLLPRLCFKEVHAQCSWQTAFNGQLFQSLSQLLRNASPNVMPFHIQLLIEVRLQNLSNFSPKVKCEWAIFS